jgi:hypothetical protein
MPRKNSTQPHKIFRFASSCQQKRRYPTEKMAMTAADDQMLIHYDLQLAVYKCESCSGWHLTRQLKTK